MADDKKNPLDALEELLQQSQSSNDNAGNANNANSASTGDGDKKPKEKTKEELAAELELQRKAYEEKQKAQKVVDEGKLTSQREAIMGIKDMPEYQVRVQQDDEKKKEVEKKAKASDGFEINQLGHKKV